MGANMPHLQAANKVDNATAQLGLVRVNQQELGFSENHEVIGGLFTNHHVTGHQISVICVYTCVHTSVTYLGHC